MTGSAALSMLKVIQRRGSRLTRTNELLEQLVAKLVTYLTDGTGERLLVQQLDHRGKRFGSRSVKDEVTDETRPHEVERIDRCALDLQDFVVDSCSFDYQVTLDSQ